MFAEIDVNLLTIVLSIIYASSSHLVAPPATFVYNVVGVVIGPPLLFHLSGRQLPEEH